MISGEKDFIKTAKELLDNIGFFVLAMENAEEKDKAAKHILSKLESLLELYRAYDLEELCSFVENLKKLVKEIALKDKLIDAELSDFMLDAFERIMSLVESAEKEGFDILKKPELKELENKISDYLNEMEKILYIPVVHTDDTLYTIPPDNKKFLSELLHKGGDIYEVSMQAVDSGAMEVDIVGIFCKLREIGEVVHIAADNRNLPSLKDFDPSVPYVSLNFVVVTDKSAKEIEEAILKIAGTESNIRLLVSPVFPDAVMDIPEPKNSSAANSTGEDKVNEVLDLVLSQQELFYQVADTPEERRRRGDMVMNVLQRVAEYMGWITKGQNLIEAFKKSKSIWHEKFSMLINLVNKDEEKTFERDDSNVKKLPIIESNIEKKTENREEKISIRTEEDKNGLSEIEITKTVKVEQAKVDELMNLIGELIVVNNGLSYMIRKIEMKYGLSEITRELKEQQVFLKRIGKDLQDIVMSFRLFPIRYIFDRFPRMVREISKKLNKKVRFVTEGEETQIDKNIVTALYEPMLHIIRNAIDHGIEEPEERLKAGKPEEGTLILRAQRIGDKVLIEAKDDGRGIDPNVILAKAVEKGFISVEEAEKMDVERALELLFIPGFSTSDAVTELSGRGVGMDVIKDTVKKLGGNVRLVSKVGMGTSVFMEFPVTMATSRVLLVTLLGQYYAFPLESVRELVKIKPQDIKRMKQREIVVLREEIMPLLRLKEFIGIQTGKENEGGFEEYPLVVLNSGMAVMVDEFIGEQEIIVRPLPEELSSAACFLGAAILGDGNIVLVLNPDELSGGI